MAGGGVSVHCGYHRFTANIDLPPAVPKSNTGRWKKGDPTSVYRHDLLCGGLYDKYHNINIFVTLIDAGQMLIHIAKLLTFWIQ